MATKYRIISLDGGGLRGLITANLLHRLTEDPGLTGWLNRTTLFAGTSTGGILALGLAAGMKPSDIRDLYKNRGKRIFSDSIWDNVRDMGRLVGAEYSGKNLKAELRAVFGSKTLSDLQRKVAIPTFDLDNEEEKPEDRTWKPKIFHNFRGRDSDGKALAADVALYTSSAPTYFPSADGYIDGGVYANNPSIVGIAQAISQRNVDAEKATLDDVVLLSVGTGVTPAFIKGRNLDWGYAQWAKPLVNLLMDGVAGGEYRLSGQAASRGTLSSPSDRP